MKHFNRVRILSSLVLIIAYGITMYYDTKTGARLYMVGNVLSLPYMIKTKCWDIVGLLSLLIILGLPKVFS
jgi:hypothetical protein